MRPPRTAHAMATGIGYSCLRMACWRPNQFGEGGAMQVLNREAAMTPSATKHALLRSMTAYAMKSGKELRALQRLVVFD